MTKSKKETAKNNDFPTNLFLYSQFFPQNKPRKYLYERIGVLTKSHEYRTKMYEKYNLTCAKCGAKGRRKKLFSSGEEGLPVIYAHRIKPMTQIIKETGVTMDIQALMCPEFWDENNIVLLCVPCYKKNLRLTNFRKLIKS